MEASGCLSLLMLLLAPFLLFFGIQQDSFMPPEPYYSYPDSSWSESYWAEEATAEMVPEGAADLAEYVYGTLINQRRFEEAEVYLCQADFADLKTFLQSDGSISIESISCSDVSNGRLSCTAEVSISGVSMTNPFEVEYANGVFCSAD